MKTLCTLAILLCGFFQLSYSQTAKKTSATEKQLTDSLCNCVSKIDISKITDRTAAITAYTNCVTLHMDLVSDLAKERGIDITDLDAMRALGVDLAKDLMAQNCTSFTQLSVTMAKDRIDAYANGATGVTSGTFKRMDQKGFNYFVLSVQNGGEKSFLWLKQFPGSENFMNGTANLIGKKLKIGWNEIEVYLPAAKGYYKIKEITSVEIQ